MLMKLNDLTKLSAQIQGAQNGKIQGVYLTDESSVRDIAVDFGAFLDAQVVAIPSGNFGAPDASASTWSVNMDSDALKTAVQIGQRPETALGTLRDLVGDSLPDQHDGLRNAATYKGLNLALSDGPVGRVLDIVVDTGTMTVPFIVVETGSWLPERQILLPMATLRAVNWADKTADITVSREEIKNAPDVFNNDQLTTTGTGTLMTYYGLSA